MAGDLLVDCLDLAQHLRYNHGVTDSTPSDHTNTAAANTDPDVPPPPRRRLPAERSSIAHDFDISGTHGSIVVSLYDNGRPAEVFLHVAQSGSFVSGLFDAVACQTSIALQHGIPLSVIAAKMIGTRFEPNGFTGDPRVPECSSILDYIYRWLTARFPPA